MSTTLLVGLDGEGSGDRAVAYAIKLANLIGDVDVLITYVIEWSPYSFQTAEENAQRRKRRDEEIGTAMERIVAPAVQRLKDDNINAFGIVKHGDVADILNAVAIEKNATQIIVSRNSEGGFAKRIFGSSTANLVMSASVPVTVVA